VVSRILCFVKRDRERQRKRETERERERERKKTTGPWCQSFFILYTERERDRE